MIAWVVAIVGLCVAVFLSRSIYRLLAPQHVDGDGYDFLLQIEDIRAAGHRRPDHPSQVVTSGVYSYPYLLPWVLSFCPARYLPLVERYFSGLSDLLLASLLVSLVPLDVLTVEQVAIALILFVFTPQFVRPNLSHGNGLSARKPGLLFVTIGLLGLSWWIAAGEILGLAITVVAGALTMLTSKFGLQAWLVVVVAFTVGLAVRSIVVVPLALGLAIALTRGRYWQILSGHLQHVADYATEKQYKRFEHSFPNPIAWFAALARASSTGERLEIVYETRWLRAIVDTPYVPLVALLVADALARGAPLPISTAYALWIGSLLLAFVATSLPHLLFLGQAERYLEYALVPALVLVARRFTADPGFVTPLLGVAAGVGLLTQVAYVWAYRNLFVSPEREETVRDLVAALSDREPGVVLVQPAFLARQIAYETPHRVVERLAGNSQSTPEASREINRLFPETYDFVTDEVGWLATTYDVDWVVFDLEKLREASDDHTVAGAPGLTPPAAEPLWSNRAFEIYRFEQLQGADA